MANIPADVFYASISELSARLRGKEFSCVELTRAFCDRFERVGARYNAVALSLREQAVRQAKDVDTDIKISRFRGPLHGIPYVAKDLIAVKDQPTAWGARPLASQIFLEDAGVIEKLNSTRAILIGKSAMVSLAGGGNYQFAGASMSGPGLNPWDRTRWSGGSSSGSASAVSAGLAPFALGSETSGSILTPSAYCGITGFRPTYGLVSRRGAMALSWTLDKIGPMARSALDCALVLQTIAGNDNQDPGSAGKDFTYTSRIQRRPDEITVGFAPVDFDEWAEPATRAVFRTALDVISGQGYRMKEIALPDFPYGAVLSTILAGEAGSIFEDFIRSGQVNGLHDAQQIAGLKSYLDLPSTDYLRAMRVRSLIIAAMKNVLLDVNVMLTPTRFDVADKISDPLGNGSRSTGRSTGLSRLIPAANLTGLPAISFPCGFADGLPVGLSVVGRPFYDSQLISIGELFQKQTDWHKHQPSVDA